MSELQLEAEYLKQQVARVMSEARSGLSQQEALQVESRLLVSQVALLQLQVHLLSATPSGN